MTISYSNFVVVIAMQSRLVTVAHSVVLNLFASNYNAC